MDEPPATGRCRRVVVYTGLVAALLAVCLSVGLIMVLFL